MGASIMMIRALLLACLLAHAAGQSGEETVDQFCHTPIVDGDTGNKLCECAQSSEKRACCDRCWSHFVRKYKPQRSNICGGEGRCGALTRYYKCQKDAGILDDGTGPNAFFTEGVEERTGCTRDEDKDGGGLLAYKVAADEEASKEDGLKNYYACGSNNNWQGCGKIEDPLCTPPAPSDGSNKPSPSTDAGCGCVNACTKQENYDNSGDPTGRLISQLGFVFGGLSALMFAFGCAYHSNGNGPCC